MVLKLFFLIFSLSLAVQDHLFLDFLISNLLLVYDVSILEMNRYLC